MKASQELEELIAACKADSGLALLVFAGAGVSVEPPTSFPTSAALTAEIIRALCSAHPLVADRSDEYVKLTYPIRLELMLDILLERVGSEVMNCLRGFCRDATPNLAHRSVACLVKELGRNSLIVTTNFDWMFEKALENGGVTYKQTIAVPTDGLRAPRSRVPEVIKLHGSVFDKNRVDTFHTLQAAIAQVGRPVHPQFRRRFLSLLRNHNIVVVGYSGLDDFDLRDLWIEAGKRAHGRLFWIHHFDAGPPAAQAEQIVDAWKGTGQLVRAHTSKLLCKAAGLRWKNHTGGVPLDWFSDFVFDPRIRDLALHGLTRLLIQVSTMMSSPSERLKIAEEVDWLLERSRELESLQSERRRYWAIKDQASGLPETERRHHLVRAAGVLSEFVLSGRADKVMPTYERAVGMRELAWGIKDLSAPGESWKDREQECKQIADLYRRSFELAKKDFGRRPESPRLFEHYLHSARDHAWGQLFAENPKKASEYLQEIICDIEHHPAQDAFWHAERILDEIAHIEADLARLLTIINSWNEASAHYMKAARKYRRIGRLAEYWVCIGCSAAALKDESAFEAACEELTTLQANHERERLLARREKWLRQRSEYEDGNL